MRQVILVTSHPSKAYHHQTIWKHQGGQVTILNQKELEEHMKEPLKAEVICLLEDDSFQTGEISQSLLILDKQTIPYLWVFTSSEQFVYRKVYAQLGATGTVYTKHLEVVEEVARFTFQQLKDKEQVIAREEQAEAGDGRFAYQLDAQNVSIIVEETSINLTKLEFQLLSILYQQAGQTIGYKELGQKMWEVPLNEEESRYRAANIVFKIRSKLSAHRKNPDLIQTVRSVGYRLERERKENP